MTQAKPEDTLDLCRFINDDLAATVARLILNKTQPTICENLNKTNDDKQAPFPICGSWNSSNAGAKAGGARNKESGEQKKIWE